MARAYLRPGPARRLVVEIDHVRGRRPSGGTVAHLGAVLERELDKPVAVRVDDEIPPTGGRHSVADLAGLEERYRSAHSRGDEAAMWLVWLDGALEEDPSSLGVAYRASAAAIFRDRIDSAATVLVPASAIERSVAVHEAGHLLALVHIGYSIPHEHEDPDHPRHSRFRDSVMYWAIEDISIASILRGGPPDDFDAVDRDDLRELRTGTA